MISEIFGLLGTVDVIGKGTNRKFRVNLNRNRIRSISAYSSNSIFYFPLIVADDATPEEVTMVSRMTERVNASFVVACISLMPFHRVKADDKAAIEDYLNQFHQNIGMDNGSQTMSKMIGLADTLVESPDQKIDGLEELQDFLYETWQESKKNNTDFLKLVSESVSINDMYNIEPVDARTKLLQEQYHQNMEELETWGFLGEATDEMFDDLSYNNTDELYVDEQEIDPEDYYDYADTDGDDMDEAVMRARKRNSLPDDAFGLPKVRKFPLNDEKHVQLAVQMFKHCPEKDRPTLAANIRKAAAKFKMDLNVGKDSTAGKYMNESSVGEAINSIKFSLESVSENKILSCKNLTKLRTLEAKLNKLKNRYVKYLNRYKKKYKENKKKGSKSKLLIRFNGMTIGDPKAFMQQFGEYVKIINKRLKLVEKRREELRKRRGEDTKSTTKSTTRMSERKNAAETEPEKNADSGEEKLEESVFVLSDEDIKIVDHCIDLAEAALSAPDSDIFDYEDEEDDWDDEDFDDEDLDVIDDSLLEAQRNPTALEKTMENNRRLRRDIANQQKGFQKQTRELQSERARRERAEKAFKAEKERNRELAKEARLASSGRRSDGTPMTRAELAEKNREISDDKFDVEFDKTRMSGELNPYRTSDARHTEFRTFDKEVFTDMDMRKANDAVPTFAKANIGFVIDETEEVVSRDVMIGIKSYVHRAPAMELISDVYNCVINKRKFLKFVKFITGEERSLSDLVFGIKELRSDALDARGGAGEWRSAFKRRRRWAKMSIPYLMKEYTPNGTLVMTMNDVNFIKSEYGVDIMTPEHVRIIMDTDFLLSFVILDQANEVLYVTYDGHGYGFQEYTYASLDREAHTSDRALRELYRSFSR